MPLGSICTSLIAGRALNWSGMIWSCYQYIVIIADCRCSTDSFACLHHPLLRRIRESRNADVPSCKRNVNVCVAVHAPIEADPPSGGSGDSMHGHPAVTRRAKGGTSRIVCTLMSCVGDL